MNKCNIYINNFSTECIRLINKLIGIKFKISEFEEDDYDEDLPEEIEENYLDNSNDSIQDYQDNNEKINTKKYIFSCIGIGLKNSARIEI